jgi:hypothetical protein
MAALALTWYDLQFPAGFDHDQATGFTRLLAIRPRRGLFGQVAPIVCEVVGVPGGLRWRVGMTDRDAELLLPQLRTRLSSVAVRPVDDRGVPPLDWAVELRLDNRTRPLRTDIAEAVAAALLTAIGDVDDGEAVVLSWVVGSLLARPAVQRGEQLGLLADPLESEEATALRAKLAEPVLGVVGRIGAHAATVVRGAQLVEQVAGALELTRAAGVGFVVRYVGGRRAVRRLAGHRGPLWDWPCPLNAAELACVLGWPVGNPYLTGVAYRGHQQLPAATGNWVSDTAAAAAPAGRYRVLGRSTFPGREGLVHLPVADALHHLHVVGPTGAGKSVLLARLIDADMDAGRSVVVIEPKSDLIAAVADRIPADRIADVVLIDPTDRHHAVGIDVLGGPNPELSADRLVHVLRTLFRDAWGPRTEQVIYTAAVALARTRGTLVELPLLLTDPSYRRSVLEQAPDPIGTGPFWQWFDRLTERERANVVGPSLNRLAAFVGRRAIRGIVGQHSPRFQLGDVFARPRVLLVNLARGLIGPEAARLLGSLVVSQLWQTALAQAALPPQRRRPVMVYIDEFHDYVGGITVDFGDMLAQARSLAVGLTIAHQGLHQLDPTTRAGVLTNARSRVVFQTTGPDAQHLANALGGLTPDDLAALGAYHAYAALTLDGATGPPASIATLPPLPGRGTTELVRRRSREQWARPSSEVDAAILAARQTAPTLASLGQRPRQRP